VSRTTPWIDEVICDSAGTVIREETNSAKSRLEALGDIVDQKRANTMEG